MRSLINGFFIGNYFYGICAVALTVEATVQQEYPLNSILYFVLVFTATVWYYTLAYLNDKPGISKNDRTRWYLTNKKFVYYSQLTLVLISLAIIFILAYDYYPQLISVSLNQLFLFIPFPLVAIAYYGISGMRDFNLRKIGWLKPFVIGFSWAGLTTIYPLLYYNIIHDQELWISVGTKWLFIKNFMFVSVLCILFDIKDYESDANQNIKTFVVHKGLGFTIFNIVIPLSIAGLISLLIFSYMNNFSLIRIILNSLPFFALVGVAYSLQKRKSILFYLAIIDGLMLFKAACGILAYYIRG
ncbi:MAG: hypothetical protein ABI528_01830 [bacterium]